MRACVLMLCKWSFYVHWTWKCSFGSVCVCVCRIVASNSMNYLCVFIYCIHSFSYIYHIDVLKGRRKKCMNPIRLQLAWTITKAHFSIIIFEFTHAHTVMHTFYMYLYVNSNDKTVSCSEKETAQVRIIKQTHAITLHVSPSLSLLPSQYNIIVVFVDSFVFHEYNNNNNNNNIINARYEIVLCCYKRHWMDAWECVRLCVLYIILEYTLFSMRLIFNDAHKPHKSTYIIIVENGIYYIYTSRVSTVIVLLSNGAQIDSNRPVCMSRRWHRAAIEYDFTTAKRLIFSFVFIKVNACVKISK